MNRTVATLISLFIPLASIAKAGIADVAEEDPSLFMMMVIIILAFVIMMLAGIIIICLVAGIVMLLVGAGILSLSVFAGWYHRSVSKGISTFLHLSFATAGIIAALLLILALNILHIQAAATTSFCISIIVAGGFAGWLSLNIAIKVMQLLIDRLREYKQ